MHRIKQLGIALAIIMVIGMWVGSNLEIASAAKDTAVPMVPMNFSGLAEKARPGVVNIRTETSIKGGGRVFRHFFGNPFQDRRPRGEKDPFEEFFGPFFRNQPPQRDFKQRSLGSGFILDDEGYIVTNNHVIENADKIKVTLSNENEYDATLVGRDPKTDLALIKIEPPPDLKVLQWGDSEDIQVGSWVVAIGSPFGLEQTVTAGIVSAKGRIIGSGPYDDFIQTDASINPGNSGGPLLNMQGEVVGINTAIVASGQGIGFAIPTNLARGIIDQLKDRGEVTRGWLGVGIQSLTPELAEYYGIKDKKGVLVTQVFEDDPADKAGIQPKDIIIAVDGNTVSTGRELSMTVANLPVGKRTKVTLLRDGKEKTVNVTLGKRDDDKLQARAQGESEETEMLGLKLADVTPESARQLGFNVEEKGVLITEVESQSKADEAGLREGDLIKEINHKPIKTVSEFTDRLDKIDSGEAVMLLIRRPNAGFLVAKLDK